MGDDYVRYQRHRHRKHTILSYKQPEHRPANGRGGDCAAILHCISSRSRVLCHAEPTECFSNFWDAEWIGIRNYIDGLLLECEQQRSVD